MQIPSATYRIQLNDHFTFRDLAPLIDYLHELGISTIYASPITTAFKGSQHGYDVTDPLTLSPEIGTEAELEQLAVTLKEYNMNWLQDIVPNHMAYDPANPWLHDVLEKGKESPFYSFFDIIEPTGTSSPDDKLMAPFLGKPLTECLRDGELTLVFIQDRFFIRYFDKDYPVALHLYDWIGKLAGGDLATGARVVNGRPDLLATLLDSQFYRLTHFEESFTQINYRRFFTVNSLICLCMEKEEVFNTYHEQIYQWYRKGWIQGLRVDHIDGLAAPKNYLDRLNKLFGEDCYIIAEKILTKDEILPDNWLLQGTTGYDFLSWVNQVLTDPEGSRRLLAFYEEQIVTQPSYEDLVFEKKYNFLRYYMGGELDHLLHLLPSSFDSDRGKEALAVLMASFPVYRVYPDSGPLSDRERLVVKSAFEGARRQRPLYADELAFLERLFDDRDVEAHEEKNDETTGKKNDETAWDETTTWNKSTARNRLMQFTGPLAAKGIEDTSFYVYNPYIAHNEVGDSPAITGITPAAFHEKILRRSPFPHSMNATTTHDTKRGEDSRIRLNLLSAKSGEWIELVKGWRQVNRSLIQSIEGRPAPSANDEYLIYQALLGGFPEDGILTEDFLSRFSSYLTKALREAKTETTYEQPDKGYEETCQAFVTSILQENSPFLASFAPFAARVIRDGEVYCLSQLLVKLTVPGVPDIYQGAEGWETSFVDPDNRRPVDYPLRKEYLRQIKTALAESPAAAVEFVLSHSRKGAAKLFTIFQTLTYRNAYPKVFSDGEYIPLPVEGPVLGYIRRFDNDWALVLVPLIRGDQPLPASFSLRLPDKAPDTWTHLFTGETIRLSGAVPELKNVWKAYPVALFTAHNERMV